MELKGTSKTPCGFVQTWDNYENSIWPRRREIRIRAKKGIDENPFSTALEYLQEQEKLKKLRNEKSTEAMKSAEGEKSVNIPISSSFGPQKQFHCPVKASRITNHDTELQKSDAVATTTTEEPMKQMNCDSPMITSDISPFDPPTILKRSHTRSVTDSQMTLAVISKTVRELDDNIKEKKIPTMKEIFSSIEKFNRKLRATAIKSKSRARVDAKSHKNPSLPEEGQQQMDNEKPLNQPNVTELNSHETSKEHINDSFATDTVDATSELNSSKISHSEVQNYNCKHKMDNESCHEARRGKRKKNNEKSDAHVLLRNPQKMADEINKTLHKYYLTDRIPGKQSYCTIAKEIHKNLVKNKISDERAISKFVVAFVTGKKP